MRLRALEVLLPEAAYPDVVREAQELVELAQKAMLRQVGMETAKQHDVGPPLLSVRDRFAPEAARLPDLARGSAWLRREREFAFYEDIDVIPTEAYGRQEADRTLAIALTAVDLAQAVVPAVE